VQLDPPAGFQAALPVSSQWAPLSGCPPASATLTGTSDAALIDPRPSRHVRAAGLARPREVIHSVCESFIGGCRPGLYRLVDAAYEKRSVAISSNLHPAAFDELMPKTLATATVDRLLHHAHVCQTSGDSVRLSQALAGQGVMALT
jgi:hypothetical protein